MTKEEFLNRLKEINIKTQDNNFFLEYNVEVCDILTENEHLKDNWNKLKEDLITDIKYWEEQEKEWIKLGFMKFGGEANSKIIFKKVLNKMQELEECDNK